jgi:hypothetical protein
MSMFTVTGRVMHVFDQPGQINKETGEISPDTVKVQILGNMPVKNGQSKLDMITLTVEDKKTYVDLKNKDIRLPLGFFSPSKGQIIYFVPKGSNPELSKVA